MKKPIALCLFGLAAAGAAHAQEVGRVISSTPVIQQVAVPRQYCSQQPVAVEQPNSGAGSLMGAIAGGAMGNAIGDGGGRAIATMIGLVGGAMVGNRIEGSGTQVQNYQQCTTQTTYENRAVAYNVVYEYAGRQYQVQMPQDPGPTVRLQITPISAAPPVDPNSGVIPATVATAPMVIGPPVQTVITTATPVVVPQYYYHRPYYPNVSLHLGYVRGGHRHHGHWR
jgi:uncharacterized protein YcfJ